MNEGRATVRWVAQLFVGEGGVRKEKKGSHGVRWIVFEFHDGRWTRQWNAGTQGSEK